VVKIILLIIILVNVNIIKLKFNIKVHVNKNHHIIVVMKKIMYVDMIIKHIEIYVKCIGKILCLNIKENVKDMYHMFHNKYVLVVMDIVIHILTPTHILIQNRNHQILVKVVIVNVKVNNHKIV